MLVMSIIIYSVKTYSPTQTQRIKNAKWSGKKFSNNYKNNKRTEENNEEKGGHEIRIIAFSSACPGQTVPCVLHLGG